MSVDFSGIWTANLSRSKLLGPVPRELTITIRHSDPELQEEIVVVKDDGTEHRLAFQCWTNGEPGRCLLNGSGVDGSATWEGNELAIKLRMKSGTRDLPLHDYWFLSPDGDTLSMEHRDDVLAGQITVLDRAGTPDTPSIPNKTKH